MTDYLRQKVFGFPTAVGPDGRQVAQVPPGFFVNGSSTSSSSTNGSGATSSGGDTAGSSSSSGGGNGSKGSSSGSGASGHELVTVWRDNVSLGALLLVRLCVGKQLYGALQPVGQQRYHLVYFAPLPL